MYKWMKKLHMYAGLLSFVALVIWGITGLHAVFLPSPGNYAPPEISSTREIPITPPADAGEMSDRDLANAINDQVEMPLRGGHYNIHRDDQGNLVFFIFTWNGRRDITYHEDRKVAEIAWRKNGVTSFLGSMHTAHSRRHPNVTPAQAWAYYNELSTWAFFFMTISGVYLWAITRPNLNWARWTVGVSVVFGAILWFATR